MFTLDHLLNSSCFQMNWLNVSFILSKSVIKLACGLDTDKLNWIFPVMVTWSVISMGSNCVLVNSFSTFVITKSKIGDLLLTGKRVGLLVDIKGGPSSVF